MRFKTCCIVVLSLTVAGAGLSLGHAALHAEVHRPPVWSKPVEGLRIRAVPSARQVKVGDGFSLFVMMQNVSDKPINLLEPAIFPIAVKNKDDHPYQRNQHRYNAMLVGKREQRKSQSVFEMQRADSQATQPITIAPGDVHVVILGLKTGFMSIEEDGPSASYADATRADIDFPDTSDPGNYTFQFFYNSEGFDRHPGAGDDKHERLKLEDDMTKVKFKTPPVTIQIVEAPGERPIRIDHND